ncbi:helicase-related protein [Actinomycetospora rhizophila]|uniref:Helicase-related protein n=1 Tax=Actinomycetospora rhizophila TaxID=1416876 RepID=A0ABV9Z9M0_9PSEU
MPDLGPHYGFRNELADRLLADLLGPALGDEEILDEEPLSAYVTGVLHARRAGAESRRDEAEAREDDVGESRVRNDEVVDTGISISSVQKPSAMGLTFSVDPERSPSLQIEIRAARYEPIDDTGRVVTATRAERRGVDTDSVRWRRSPLTPTILEVGVIGADAERHRVGDGLELRVKRRVPTASGLLPITVSLVNTAVVDQAEVLDPYCWFQPGVTVSTTSPAIVDRTRTREEAPPDVVTASLLHRHAPSFATGHGCSVDWPSWTPPAPGEVGAEPARTGRLVTAWVPSRDVLLTESNPSVGDISMQELALAPEDVVRSRLLTIVDAYEVWIGARRDEAEELSGTPYAEVAIQHLDECATAARRMRSGIALLQDEQVMRAFRLANETMAVQRARSAWVRAGRVGEPDLSAASWRPFQIGFVLLCLDGIADASHEDRDVADLLWFPTGGGKTEAYLGLIAFTTYLRRLRGGAQGAGVTVLMRYTLRLLTLQQFERAAALICAMEVVRRREQDLGREPMSIGMWVGRAATPNSLKEAKKALEQLAAGKQLDEENPVQLTSCPWCGTPIDHNDYEVDERATRLVVRCPSSSCPFLDGIPVHVVDETIYHAHPTLVIATSDKFALMTWKADVAAVFNRLGSLEGTPPPELIVQDELHLISGPLGSLAGLYETAVDYASGSPKVIASTATIRRADEQGRRLFDRTTRQFPPPGLDARDSWFAVEAPAARRATRSYVGVLAPGTSQATLLIRTYASLLHHAARIDAPAVVRDAYWTLVGYFSSLRLLSAAELQVHADVVERLGQLAHRDGGLSRSGELLLSELTSRLRSSEVPTRLQELFTAIGDDAQPLDVVLATNMISVGVDVDRLGLMAVMGQPQATAEYIQATSRVGRRDPGLVVTMYNASRSRDRSHYESFVPYHSALYRQVESTSVTPFAPRARDRALHAALVAMLRMTEPLARADEAAASLDTFEGKAEDLIELIGRRARSMDHSVRHGGSEVSEDEEFVVAELEEFLDRWRDLSRTNSRLRYEPRRTFGSGPRDPAAALLRGYEQDDDLQLATETMWSLRDVDVECPLYLERH